MVAIARCGSIHEIRSESMARIENSDLVVPRGFDWIEIGSLSRRIIAKADTHFLR
jgi:hypothetical protein